MKLSNNSNEVTVYRVMMYVNHLLIVQAMYSTSTWSICILHYLGVIFKNILLGEFFLHLTIEIHYTFIVCRITFSQKDVILQSFTEQYFIVNKRFWENWVKFKIQNLPIRSPKAYCIFDVCTVWIGHNPLISLISKLTETCVNIHGQVAKAQPPWIIIFIE